MLGLLPGKRASSAYGFAQALDGTWDQYKSETGNRGANRKSFDDATDFIGWYTAKSSQITGIRMNDARSQYLAYHQGPTGYLRGDWQRKPGIIRLADRVASRAADYDNQLRTCQNDLGRRGFIPFL